MTPDGVASSASSASSASTADSATASRRVAGRIILLDAADRVLLVHERVDVGAAATHWLTPGGGIENGERPAEAATRELSEESGFVVPVPQDRAVLVFEDRYRLSGSWWHQTNHFFLCRLAPGATPQADIRPTDLERELVLGLRWWSLAELTGTSATINPAVLVDTLTALLAPGIGP